MNDMQTTLCYIEKDGRTLMLHRVKKKNDMNRDKWLGVGGKFEPGESPEECMLREAKEETGLTLTRWAYRGIVTFVSGDYCEYMHLFTADAFEGALRECDEGTLEWVETDRLMKLPIWAGDKVFLRLLKEKEPFFSLKLVYEEERLARQAQIIKVDAIGNVFPNGVDTTMWSIAPHCHSARCRSAQV